MKVEKYVFLWMLGSSLLLTSCFSSKKVVYLKDMQIDSLYAITRQNEQKIKQDDKLSIVISSQKPELSIPFNTRTGSSYRVDAEGETTANSSLVTKENGYIVDRHGCIEFPVLGLLHVEGLTREELAQQIRQRLIDEKYINDPIVSVELLNMKVTMMGEVSKIGVLSIQDRHVTLMEALSRAGGLTTNACPDKVAVIREEAGQRKMLMADLRSASVFSSPAFYLQQNDIVYVQPQAARSSDKENRNWRLYSTGIGLISIITSLYVLFK